MASLSVMEMEPRTETFRLLVLTPPAHWPEVVNVLARDRGLEVIHLTTVREAREPELLSKIDAAVLDDPRGEFFSGVGGSEAQLFADALQSHRLKCVVLSPGATGGAPCEDDAFVSVPTGVSLDELWGRLSMIKHYGPQLKRLDEHVSTMQRLGKRLNRHFVEVDQELRLATRLQRDFLPKKFPEVGDVRFAAIFRPANWVSGDVYDVRRLDESHVSFYLADAVGHGVAAGLLTMFIRQSVVGKHVNNDTYQIVPPGGVLADLNRELAEQNLPNSQFVTACYATIDTRSHELTFARAGHPHPLHVNARGEGSEVRTSGGLLGVFPEETFDQTRLVLEPGEKFIIYSDGLENDIIAARDNQQGTIQFTPMFQELMRLPAPQCLATLSARLDQAEGSLEPEDDITCIIVERLPLAT